MSIRITADDRASGVLKGLQGALGGIGNVAAGALKVGLAGATAGFAALGVGIAKSVGEAMESEKAVAALNAVLASTKGAAGVTSKAAQDLATSLQRVTKFSDEMVLSAETVLLQFKAINKDAFPEATRLSLDLAERMGIDAASAARMLGKALETPGEGLLRLKAAGVAFNDEQEKMIKKMWEGGDAAGAQKLIMAELEKSIGGAATAAGQTAAGQFAILQNQFSDILETVGGAFLPSLKDLTGYVNENLMPAFKAWAEENAPKIQSALKTIGEIVGGLVKGDFSKLQTALTTGLATAKKAFEDNAPKYATAFWGWLAEVGLQVSDKFAKLTIMLNEWVISADGKRQLGEVGENIGRAIADAIGALFRDDKETQKSIGDNIALGLKAAIELIPEALADIGAGIATGMIDGFIRQVSPSEKLREDVKVGLTKLFSAVIMDVNDFLRGMLNPLEWINWSNFGTRFIWQLTQQLRGEHAPFPGYQFGGIVPGAIGQPQLAVVHGGEVVYNPRVGGRAPTAGGNITVQLTYAPALSLTDEREFRDRLQPFIEDGIIAARRRQV